MFRDQQKEQEGNNAFTKYIVIHSSYNQNLKSLFKISNETVQHIQTFQKIKKIKPY